MFELGNPVLQIWDDLPFGAPFFSENSSGWVFEVEAEVEVVVFVVVFGDYLGVALHAFVKLLGKSVSVVALDVAPVAEVPLAFRLGFFENFLKFHDCVTSFELNFIYNDGTS